MTGLPPANPRARRGWRTLFPMPYVGVAVLLAVLIVLTPVLVITGPPAPGTLLTQAELIVDRVAGGNTTYFYVRAIGTTVRYDSISFATATGFHWSGGYPSGPLTWSNWQNGTNLLELSASTPAGTVAVNVTATYSEGGSTAEYAGLVAFNVSGVGTGSESLLIGVSSSTSGVTAPGSVSVGDLPVSLLLQDFGSGGAP